MKQTRERKNTKAAMDQTAAKDSSEIKEGRPAEQKAEQPRSWRQYIEETLPAQEQAAKEAAQPQKARKAGVGAKAAQRLAQARERMAAAAVKKPAQPPQMHKAEGGAEEKKPAQRPVQARERMAAAAVKKPAQPPQMHKAEGGAEEKKAAQRLAQARERMAAAVVKKPAQPRQMRKAEGGAEEKKPAQWSVQARELARKAGKSALAAAESAWEKLSSLTAEGWDRAGRATSGVRNVVARHPISPLLYVTLLAVGIGWMSFQGTYVRAYVLEVDGEEVGLVSSQDEVDAILGNVETRVSSVLGEEFNYDAEVTLTPAYATPEEFSDAAEVEDTLFEGVGAYIEAYAISVDGVELGCAATKGELYQMLDQIAQPYIPEDAIRYEFVEDVRVYPVQLPANTLFDTQAIYDVLSALQIEEATYEVQQGDTFNAIAYSLDMWPNELSILNPDIIVDKLWIGQELVIQQAVPYLSVQAVTDETYEETIPSPVEYIETADLYVGDTKVKEQGEDGLALVNAHVTYVNGVEMEREIIQSTTLSEATTTYTYTGTTPRPVTASNGYYIWPVRGTITSNFGGRYLGGYYDFHLGIDIAVPYGTAIKAADGGTVIKSGWNGSYGILVAIQHDNGTVTYYGHNSSTLVNVGDKVYQGQIIARAGSTGNSTGNHCHFEVRVNGTSVNPRNYLP